MQRLPRPPLALGSPAGGIHVVCRRATLEGAPNALQCAVGMEEDAHESWTQASAEDGRRRDAARARGRGRLAAARRRARAQARGTRPRSRRMSMDETMKALGGGDAGAEQGHHVLPDARHRRERRRRAVGITSNIPKTESIAILVEKNPNMLAAVFDIPAGHRAVASTRVKMGQTSNVYALVKADGKYYVATQGNQGHARRLRRLRRDDMADPMQIRANARRRLDRGQGADEPRDGNRPAQGRAGQDRFRRGSSRTSPRRGTARPCSRRNGDRRWRRTRSSRSSSRAAPRATRS